MSPTTGRSAAARRLTATLVEEAGSHRETQSDPQCGGRTAAACMLGHAMNAVYGYEGLWFGVYGFILFFSEHTIRKGETNKKS